MFILYSLLIRIYGLCILLAAIISPKARALFSGRRKQTAVIRQKAELWQTKRKIWIHAASLGEYEMSIPIIKELEQNENVAVIVSFHSPSGYEHVTFEGENRLKIYLPLDTYSEQQEMIRLLRPDKVVFIKYEFWFNMLRVLTDESVPYYFTSLHLNSNSYLFKDQMKPFLELIKGSRKIYCHNNSSAEILRSHHFDNLEIFGDSRLQQVQENSKISTGVIRWKEAKPVIALGSLQKEEVKIFSRIINDNTDKNFLVAPHDTNPATIKMWKKAIKEKVDLFSNLAGTSGRVLLVDTIGDLKYLYRSTHVAYVGGGFRKGPHNLLEPLVYGVPICTGPNIEKFPMAQELTKRGFVISIPEIEGIELVLSNLLRINRQQYYNAVVQFFGQQQTQIKSLIQELMA